MTVSEDRFNEQSMIRGGSKLPDSTNAANRGLFVGRFNDQATDASGADRHADSVNPRNRPYSCRMLSVPKLRLCGASELSPSNPIGTTRESRMMFEFGTRCEHGALIEDLFEYLVGFGHGSFLELRDHVF